MNDHFSDPVMVRLSPAVKAALNEAARRQGSKPTQYARQAVMAALQRDGLDPLQQQQFALVANGELVMGQQGHPCTTYRPQPDRRGEWLPIENEDSAPFDPVRHWRMQPLPLRVDGNRVVRLYPIVVKSLEHA